MSAPRNENATVSSNVLFSLTERQQKGWAGGSGVIEGTAAQER